MANEPSTQSPSPSASPVDGTSEASPRRGQHVDAKTATIEVTPAAVEAIKKQIAKRGTSGTSLRVGIRGGGCSGFSYVIEFHDGPPRARDRVLDFTAKDGTPVRVVVDPKSLLYLNGAALDWEQTLMQQGFKFVNPHEKSSCGCGHSFTV
jgi:iron-sulfur cluster assembly protein